MKLTNSYLSLNRLTVLMLSFLLLSCQFAFSIGSPLFKAVSGNSPVIERQLSKYQLLKLNPNVLESIMENQAYEMNLDLPMPDGHVKHLALVKNQLLANDFKLRTSTGQHTFSPGLYYRVKGENGKWAGAVSFFREEVIAVLFEPSGNFVLGAIQQPESQSYDYLFYNDADLKSTNPFECGSLAIPGKPYTGMTQTRTTSGDCQLAELYMEADYATFTSKGSVNNVTNYVTGFMNAVQTLYLNESIHLVISELFVWTSLDPYPNTSSLNALTAFSNQLAGSFNGDIAHLVSMKSGNLGGIAYLDALCDKTYGVGFSNISGSYNAVPTYSWTVEVVTHEMGHNFGSRHTHDCVWNGNNTAIDGCGPTAGYAGNGSCANAGLPVNGGTIMSYCHLTSAGINFSLGFGSQPGTVIRSGYANATCMINPVVGSLSASNDGAKCPGETISLHATAYPGSTFSWTGPAGFISSDSTPQLVNVHKANKGTYSVSARYGDCTTNPVSTIVGVNTCIKPSFLTATNLTSTSAKLNWAVANCAVSYRLQYRIVGSTTWLSASVTTNTKTLTGLTPSSTYEYQVISKCASNPNEFSLWSNLKTFATKSLRLGNYDFSADDFVLAPNPATSGTQVQLSLPEELLVDVRLLNALGQECVSQRQVSEQVNFDTADMLPGLYVVQVLYQGEAIVSKRLIIADK